jgi:hypothetical protein
MPARIIFPVGRPPVDAVGGIELPGRFPSTLAEGLDVPEVGGIRLVVSDGVSDGVSLGVSDGVSEGLSDGEGLGDPDSVQCESTNWTLAASPS